MRETTIKKQTGLHNLAKEKERIEKIKQKIIELEENK